MVHQTNAVTEESLDTRLSIAASERIQKINAVLTSQIVMEIVEVVRHLELQEEDGTEEEETNNYRANKTRYLSALNLSLLL